MLTKQHVLFQLTYLYHKDWSSGHLALLCTLMMSLMLSVGKVCCSNSTLMTHSCMPARGQMTSRAYINGSRPASPTAQWCSSRCLQLNADKMETFLVGSRANITKLATQDQSLLISSEMIKPTTIVRDLGVLLDSELSMKHHVTKLVVVCHYHLRHLQQIRHVGMENGDHHSSHAGHNHITTKLP